MSLILALVRQRQVDLWVQGQPGLLSKLQDSQDYTEKPCLEKKKDSHSLERELYSEYSSLSLVLYCYRTIMRV